MHLSHVILKEWRQTFLWHIFEYPYTGGVLTLQHCWLWHGCCCFGAHSVSTIQPCTSLQCHSTPSQVHRVHVCLAVICHLHFWQNDRHLLYATVVTLGWNEYRNKCQHRKLTLEKKIPPQLLLGPEPVTFRSWVRCSKLWAIPAP